MSSTTVKINYRPIKIGFLVRDNVIDDLVKVAGYNTILWGGKNNLIIPVDEKIDLKLLITYLQIDCLIPFENSNIFDDILKEFTFLKTNYTSISNSIFFDKEIAFLDIANNIENYKKDDENSNISIINWDRNNENNALYSILFGCFPQNILYDYPYKEKLIEYFEPEILNLSNKPLKISKPIISPIDFTTIDLLEIRQNNYNSFFYESISIYIGRKDNYEDLVTFWNLRSLGFSLLYYSKENQEMYSQDFNTLISSINLLNKQKFQNYRRLNVFFLESNNDVDDIINNTKTEIDRISLKSHLNILSLSNVLRIESKKNDFVLANMAEEKNKKKLSFRLPEIVNLPKIKHKISHQQYITSINIENDLTDNATFNIPFLPDLHEFYSRKIVDFIKPYDLRCEPFGTGIIVTPNTVSHTLQPIQFREIIFKIFEISGFKVSKSQPGLIADHIINSLGGLDKCRIFKIKGVRDILKSLKINKSITISGIQNKIRENDFKSFKSLYIEKRNTRDLKEVQVVDFMLRNDFFRAGLDLNCNSCNLSNWLSVNRLSDFWECNYCGANNQLNTMLKNSCNWKFRKSGLFAKENNQEGAIPVILTLMLLYRVLQNISKINTMIFSTAINVLKPNKCEIDFFVINLKSRKNFEIGFGECKDKGGEIDNKDISNLKSLYDEFKAKYFNPYLIFSKTSDKFLERELKLFKKTKEEGYNIIIFSNKELEPYSPYKNYNRSELLREYPFSLEDLCLNSAKIYL